MTETATQAPESEQGQEPSLVHVDPNDLIFTTNVRADARLDEGFVASITEHGVIEPVIATRREDGALVIRAGHRRTLAAAQAGRTSIPVYVVPATSEAARVVDQMAENDHRTGLSTGERVAAFAQLDALGMTAAQIVKATATKPAHVKAALVVAGSTVAAGASARFDFLTLDQAATLADFEDQEQTVTALVAAAKTGQFDHVAQRARDERDLHRQGEAIAQQLREAGINVIDNPGYGGIPQRLNHIKEGGTYLTIETHAQCPGHAAYVSADQRWVSDQPVPEQDEEQHPEDEEGQDQQDGDDYDYDDYEEDDDADEEDESPAPRGQTRRVTTMVAVYVCCDPAKYGHRDPFSTSPQSSTKVKAADLPPAERAARKAERDDVVESNKGWASAKTVRRQWMETFAKRKSAPKSATHFIATTLFESPHLIDRAGHSARTYALDLLGSGTTASGGPARAVVSETTTVARAQMISLVILLAAYEHAMTDNDWRHTNTATARYLRFLTAQGYGRADVEVRACGEQPQRDDAQDGDQAA